MNLWFVGAAVIAIAIGLLHSFLGERLVLGPLSRLETLPKLIGSRRFMIRVLRFAWHVTSVLLFGLAAVGVLIARPGTIETEPISTVLVVTYLACAVVALAGSRGRHFSWVLFLAAGLLTWAGALN